MPLEGRHLQHLASLRADRQERRIGGPALLTQRRQHDLLNGIEAFEGGQQSGVEPATAIAVGGRRKLVVEAEPVEKGAQPGIIVRPETLVSAIGVAHHRQRLVQVLRQLIGIGQTGWDFPQAVHIVAKRDQSRGDGVAGQTAKGHPNHGGARHFSECAQVRETRRAIAGLEHHRLVQGRKSRHRLGGLSLTNQAGRQVALAVRQPQTQDAVEQQPSLFKGPRLGIAGGMGQTLQRHGPRVSPLWPQSQAPIAKLGRMRSRRCRRSNMPD